MSLSDLPDQLIVLAIGLLVLMAPVPIIAITVGVLVFTGNLILEGVTLLVFLERYLIDLVLVAGFARALSADASAGRAPAPRVTRRTRARIAGRRTE